VREESTVPVGEVAQGSLFRREGDWFEPTPLTTGPWRPDAQNGGAPSSLVGALISEVVEEGELVAGVQIDLERPVPLAALRASVRRQQSSRRVSRLSIELSDATGRVVAARALLLRGQALPVLRPTHEHLEGPEGLTSLDWRPFGGGEAPAFHRDSVEHRIVCGGYGVPEPTAAWLRLRSSVIEGESTSGLAQLLALADFGSPLGSTVERDQGVGLINVDINVALFRPAMGGWFLLDASGEVGVQGVGLAVTRLSDTGGPLGIITQSQIGHRSPTPS
jgi:hypothetical protein